MKNSLTPEAKDFGRIRDLAKRVTRNMDELDLARLMAESITTYEKAVRRGRAAEQLGMTRIASVFFGRAAQIVGK